MRLGVQVELGASGAVEQVEGEIPGEDQGLEQHEGPHVGLAGNEPGAFALLGYLDHRAAAFLRSPAASGPVPRSSRRIIWKSMTMKVTW